MKFTHSLPSSGQATRSNNRFVIPVALTLLLLTLAGALIGVNRLARTKEQSRPGPVARSNARMTDVKKTMAQLSDDSSYGSLSETMHQSLFHVAPNQDRDHNRTVEDRVAKGKQTPATATALASGPATIAERLLNQEAASSNDGVEESLSANKLTPLLRAPRVPYYSAAPGARINTGDRRFSQDQTQETRGLQQNEATAQNRREDDGASRKPREESLIKAHEFKGDLRTLPRRRPVSRERRELEPPDLNPSFYVPPGSAAPPSQASAPVQGPPIGPQLSAPAPAPINVFEGLDRFNWGAGSPPDTNGDVGPTHYIQTVNTSIGIFRKTDGFQEAAFTFDTFMSQGNFGNLCDTNNFGDPVVVYDTFEDRWIISDFAFLTDISGNVLAPAYQCFATSQTGDPLAGGWNYYSRQISDNLNDYPKFGIWPDGLYMSANMFSFGAGSAFKTARVWAFDKAQMYAGSPTIKVVSFDIGGSDFTVIPSNARLQTGTPPAGRPNLFISTQLFLNALTVYKFHVDFDHISLSTFTGPDTPIAATSWPAAAAAVPQPGTAQTLDSLSNRAMVQNQYASFSGTESLWVSHTVRRGNASGFAAPRWYQVNVTGGTVAGSIPQAATWDPNAANVIHRWMPSLALDRAGNMAMGYSTSNSTTEFPSIKYAGRLAADPVNTFSQTEQTFFTGTASQTSSTRWGDYSAMTLDPDGCTFWYTTEYANPADQTFNHRWLTKFGSIGSFPGCTPVGAGGTVSGTVTVTPGGSPITAATIMLGARSTTTDGSGNYSFTGIPAGIYPSMTANAAGYDSAAATSIVVTDGGTTTQDFALTIAPTSACLTDTTQADFLTGVPTTVDLNTSPGDVMLPIGVDQQNTAGTTTGTGFGTPNWTGQTFIPTHTGLLVKADVQLFCNGCGATPPNLTLSVRNTAAGLPTGADLATVTIPGSAFATGTVLYTASFDAPATVTSGTQYALVLRPVSAPAGSGYFWIRSSPSTYANGSRVLSADSGGTWSSDTTRDYNFKVYIGFALSGNLVSSPKDANPAVGFTPIWSTFSWNGSTPANTSLQFQLAGSNNVNGPFNFVGPDGTAATFFTSSPVQLSPQFYNFRYLEYKALLATADSAATPVLNDATACFNDVDCSSTVATITPTPSSVCTSASGNTASGPAGMTSYAWGITNGTITSATNTQSITYTAGASGTVTLNLTVTAPSGCIVSGSAPVTINPYPATPTITPGGPTTFCAGGSVTLTSNSATGNQWLLNGNLIGGATNQTYVATASGSYTDVVTTSGCPSAASAATTITVNPIPATPTITPGGPTTFCAGGSVGLTSSSASGNQWYLNGNPIGGATNQLYSATASGNYTVTVTDGNSCTSAASAQTTVTVNPIPATPTITPGGPTTFCAGGSVGLTSSSASGNQWYLNGNPIGGATNQLYSATASGNYTVTVTDGNSCTSAASAQTGVTVNPIPATPTISAAGGTTFCAGGTVTLTSSSGTGNQWFLNGNPIGGATNQNYAAGAAGNYTVTVTTTGCTSTPSAPTAVDANTPPTVAYPAPASLAFGGSTNVTPTTATDNGSITGYNVLSVVPALTTAPTVNSSGVVSITNAQPAGSHVITIRATDNCGATTDAGFTVTVSKGNQTITFNALTPRTFGDADFAVSATASSGLAVSFSPSGNCTMAGTTVHITGAGSCTITASQAGDSNFNAAGNLPQTFTIAKSNQTITFAALANRSFGDADFNVSATATSALTVSFAPSGNCTMAGNTVHITGAGSCTITASQAGDSNFNPATNVAQTFSIAKVASSTTVTSALTPSDFGQMVTFTATVTSDAGTPTGTVQFKVDGVNAGSPATLNGSGVATFATSSLASGTRVITADYSFDSNSLTSTGTLAGGQVVKAQPSLSINDVSINEGDSGTQTLNFTVTLSAPSSLTVTLNYATADGTAIAPADYIAIPATALTFNPGDLTKTIGVTINGDTSFEANETLFVNLSSAVNATISDNQGLGTITNDDAQGGNISFSAANYDVSENAGLVTLTVNRSGDTTAAVTVDYATSDTGTPANCATFNGFASSRCDFTTALGTLKFAAGETQKTFVVVVNKDSFAEIPNEVFTVNLSNATGGAVFATPSNANVTIADSAAPAANASDDTDTFVRQQYHDFLNREPDPSGLTFWTNQITSCGADAQCIAFKRVNVSAAFFLSIEFQQSGGLVRDFYVATLDRPLTNNMPNYVEFIRDTQAVQRGIIVGQGAWQADFDVTRAAFMSDFVMRAEFVGLYATTDSPTQYVDKLIAHAAVTLTAGERSAAIAEFGAATTASDPAARGRALFRVTQVTAFQQREFNRAFVHLQYLGYLRRDPNAAPDTNFNGYNFWLNKLIQFNGNFVSAEMVKAFITSSEYRGRFGP